MNKKGGHTFVQPIYNLDDVRAIADALKKQDAKTDQPAYLIWRLCVNGGFRIGDILKLRIYQLCQTGKKVKDHITIREQKRDKVVSREIPEPIRKELQEYVNGLQWSNGVKYQSYLFESCRIKGKPYSYQWFNERLKQASYTAGVQQRVTTHSMRKTFAHHWYMCNKDQYPTESICLQFLSKQVLKHSSVTETMHYIGINQQAIDETTRRLPLL